MSPQHTQMLQTDAYLALDAATTSIPTNPTYNMYTMNYTDRSEPSSRRDSPSTSGSNTPISFGPRGQSTLFGDKVSLPPINAMFSPSPTDEYDSRRSSLPYHSSRNAIPPGAAQWFTGLNTQLDQRAHSSTPDSPATGSPTFTAGSYSSASTVPTTVKSSPGTSPFSDKLSLPASNSPREWSAPMTIPVPPSTETTVGSAPSTSPTPQSDSPPAATAAPQRRRGKLPKHVTETLRTWLLSHADHPYPTEEEKKMLCNVTSLTLSQVSNWMINARRRILVPASKQQAALNATTGPYIGLARSSAATDLARANRQSMTIPHSMPPTHAIPPPTIDAYSGAYNLPHLSQAGDLHLSSRSAPYPTISMPQRATGGYTYGAPNVPSYYGTGLSGLGYPGASALVPSGPGRYYPEHDSTHPYSATTH
ncbi:Homeobox KN domain, partial [Rhizoctonia solani]